MGPVRLNDAPMPRRGLSRHLLSTLVLITLFVIALTRVPDKFNFLSSSVRTSTSGGDDHNESLHLVERLFVKAKAAHEAALERQSVTYKQAVAAYFSRYSRQPPAGFDQWFELAKFWNSSYVDDFDEIELQLRPFRPFLQNGCDQQRYTNDECTARRIIQLCFQDGEVVQYGWREKWHEDTLNDMVGVFRAYMPNICVYINYLDEPRLLLAPTTANGAASTTTEKKFCHALDFVDVSHQNAWSEATMPCPMDSPARLRPSPSIKSRPASPFAKNFSSVTDLCQMNRNTAQGMLRSSENLRVSHDIVPVLSSSKLSTFSDILFPAPFRFSGEFQTQYDPNQEIPWEEKNARLHWRGSTTGGRGIKKNWKNFHRQHLIKALTDKRNGAIDVAFTAVTQCEDEACAAQSDYFNLADRTDINENWKYKWILDVDGNGLSGRLYDLLRSQSLVFRYTFSREWHDQRLQPWLHYIPLSNDFHEIDELLEFLATPRGDEIAQEMARAGSEWVQKALRPEDMALYFFRLLLEMASGRNEG